VNTLITRLRSGYAGEIIHTREAYRASRSALKRNRLVLIMMDQRVPAEGGLLIPFLGRPAWTTTLLALLAIKSGAPVLACQNKREGHQIRGTFRRIEVNPQATLKETPALVLSLNKELERWVRERPAEWLWMHNRWKGSS